MERLHLMKGDIVRTKLGITGEVVESWGIARSFVRVKPEDGKTIPMLETDVAEVIERYKPKRGAKQK